MQIEKIYKQLKEMYKGIDEYCQDCDLCCFTYGWIMPCEIGKYSKITNLVSINNRVTCFDSFERDKSGGKVLEKIPRCKFYKEKKCNIHSYKPFDCLLYPTKVLYSSGKREYLVVLSLDCPYIKNLTVEEKGCLKKKILSFFFSLPQKIKQEYFSMVREWEDITTPKEFEYEKIFSCSEEQLVKNQSRSISIFH